MKNKIYSAFNAVTFKLKQRKQTRIKKLGFKRELALKFDTKTLSKTNFRLGEKLLGTERVAVKPYNFN